MRASSRNGFSLVELSIALVIIGLLTGGILAGQSLLKASELRTVITDKEKYTLAIKAFREKFDDLPGDLPYATDVWGLAGGTASPTDAACLDLYKSAAATCNGDGNGLVNGTPAGLHIYVERFLTWQHLANAGFIEGSFTGRTNGATDFVTAPGINVPRNSISNAYFDFTTVRGPATGVPIFFDGNYNIHVLTLFANPSGGAIKPEDAWNIDTKLDDGMPAKGKVFTYKRSSWACASSDATTATYDFTISAPNCPLSFSISDTGV